MFKIKETDFYNTLKFYLSHKQLKFLYYLPVEEKYYTSKYLIHHYPNYFILIHQKL